MERCMENRKVKPKFRRLMFPTESEIAKMNPKITTVEVDDGDLDEESLSPSDLSEMTDESSSSAEEIEEVKEAEVTAFVRSTVPPWQQDSSPDQFDITAEWPTPETPYPKTPYKHQRSSSVPARIETNIGRPIRLIKSDLSEEADERLQIPPKRPARDSEPLPLIGYPRWVWRVESESDLRSTNRTVQIVKFQDTSCYRTIWHVYRTNGDPSKPKQSLYTEVKPKQKRRRHPHIPEDEQDKPARVERSDSSSRSLDQLLKEKREKKDKEKQAVEEVEEDEEESVENILTLDALKYLENEFRGGPLTFDQYKQAVADALQLEPGDEFPACLIELFIKIDTFFVGKISWDDLCDFIQQGYAEKAENDFASPPITIYPKSKSMSTPHRKPISTAATLGKRGVVCFSEEGMLSLWTPQFQLRQSRHLEKPLVQPMYEYASSNKAQKWYTDMCHMERLRKLFIPTGDKELQIYETNGFDPYCRITDLYSVPIHVHASMSTSNALVIAMGDVNGCVFVLWADDAFKALRHWNAQRRIDNIPTIKLADTVSMKMNVRYFKFRVHLDLVSQVQFSPGVNQVISCSMEHERSLVMGRIFRQRSCNEFMDDLNAGLIEGITDLDWKPKWRKPVDEVIFPLPTGCRCFDIWEENRWIIVGGQDTEIYVWNLYIPGKIIARLKGHEGPIFSVVFDQPSETLFSICQEKIIIHWSLVTNAKLARLDTRMTNIYGKFLYGFFPSIEAMLVQTTSQCFCLKMKRRGDDGLEKGKTHADAITAIIYNSNHELLMTCSSEDVFVWDVETGTMIGEFNTIGGDGIMHLDAIQQQILNPDENDRIFVGLPKLYLGRPVIDTFNVGDVTCVALDASGRRFFSAHTSGVIKAWNFSNGRNLYNMYKPINNDEVCDMHYVMINEDHKFLITVGWDKKVVVYLDNQTPETVHKIGLPDEPLEFVHEQLGHSDDIWTATYGYPNMLASGDYSGKILVWSISSGHILSYLKPNPCPNRCLENQKFIASLHFMETWDYKGRITQYLISSGPYRLIHIWRANNTRELNVGTVGWNRPCRTPQDYVTNMKTIIENNMLVTADTNGMVTIWKINDTLEVGDPMVWFRNAKDPKVRKKWNGFHVIGTHRVVHKPGAGKRQVGLKLRRDSGRHRTAKKVDLGFDMFWSKILKRKRQRIERLRNREKSYENAMNEAAIEVANTPSTATMTMVVKNNPNRAKAKKRYSHHKHHINKSKHILGIEMDRRKREAKVAAQAFDPNFWFRNRSEKTHQGYGEGPVQLRYIRSWKCHEGSFAALEVCNTHGLIATGAKDCSVRLWDFRGRHIGIFGQEHEWIVGDFSTYCKTPPADVMFDSKRIRALEFFQEEQNKKLKIEKKAFQKAKKIVESTVKKEFSGHHLGSSATKPFTIKDFTNMSTIAVGRSE